MSSFTNDESVDRGVTREELLRRAALAGAALAGAQALTRADAAVAAPQIKRGGTFRFGVGGGATTDIIDGQHIVLKTDQARLMATFEGLASFDQQYRPRLDGLAQELAADKSDVWTIRVRQGIEFHNGKTLTADDVIYSIRRTLDPKLGLFGRGAFSAVDPKRIRKLDSRTVRLFLKRPDVTLIDAFCAYFQGVVPVGYNPKAIGKGSLRFVGTGPYKVESFTPGRQSVHVRNENFWRSGQPYFDQVVILDLPNADARVNAFLGGQVDAITDVPFAQVPIIQRRRNLKLYESQTGGWLPISMRVDVEPFKDVRVREAFKLIADRKQMVGQALSQHGRIGNDVYSPFDLCYAGGSFPQRQKNIRRARALLSAAGHENLTVDLVTSPQQAGMVEAALVFAETAKEAGVTVNVKNVDGGVLYGDEYLKWPFSMDFWGTRNYLSQVAAGSLPTSSFNETHWNDPEFNKLYRQALAETDRKKRCALVRRMQKLEYERGGHIVWGFYNLISAHHTKVGGFKPDRGTLDLNKYGNGFRTIYFV